MGRGRLALELIGKEKSRRVTFEKRKTGLLKKAKEFSILCGVDTCVIIYGTPAISDCPHVPEIWPPNPDEVARIINRYKNEVGTGRRSTKIRGAVVGLDEYFLDRQRKLGTELAKARRSTCDDLIAHLSEEEEVISLKTLLGHRLESAKKRLEAMKSEKELAALLLPQDQTNNIAPNPLMVGSSQLGESDRRGLIFHQPMPTRSFYVPGAATGLYCRHDSKPSNDQMLPPTLFQYAANDNPYRYVVQNQMHANNASLPPPPFNQFHAAHQPQVTVYGTYFH
ncbi:agamous-like MADS-box protein AGL11 [Punica granatum]|uniref:MADS-box domain-containing protein n=2 Tax=Punica granatum TaxID=22663 RepID=A0A218Y324_PUNGR|nr:agamous-like MADS-box protein AGL11 [Punica granatum]OWM91276.1 hypothetical protein CDL15_Pgr000220 [Punica granatum]PKI61566.1 hypothetical protein CRG98_018062 [Punica granatum]